METGGEIGTDSITVQEKNRERGVVETLLARAMQKNGTYPINQDGSHAFRALLRCSFPYNERQSALQQ